MSNFCWEWESLTSETVGPAPRAGHSGHLFGSSILLAFGDNKSESSRIFYGDIWLYDINNRRWTSSVLPGKQRSHHAAVTMGPSLLVYGGASQYELLDDMFVLSSDGSVQSVNVTAPPARRGHTMVACDNKAIVYGGLGASGVMDDTWLFDANALCWLPVRTNSVPAARTFHASVCNPQGQVLLLGGKNDRSLSDVWLLDLRANNWIEQPAMSMALYGHTAHYTDSHGVLVTGGVGDGWHVNAETPLQVSSYDGNALSPLLYSSIAPQARVYHCAVWDGEKLLSMGGLKLCNSATTNSNWVMRAVGLTANATFASVPPGAPLSHQGSPNAGAAAHAHAQERKLRLKTSVILARRDKQQLQFTSRPVHDGGAALVKVDSLASSLQVPRSSSLTQTSADASEIIDMFLRMAPSMGGGVRLAPGQFACLPQEILSICENVRAVLQSEPCVVDVPAPCKVFGDLHGQFDDLLEFFQFYGMPSHMFGDIGSVNYVFDGDFVDRGSKSLEVVTLLFALKMRYPRNVFLVRGNHEDMNINRNYGFLAECRERLGEAGDSVWRHVNEVFEYLPLAAIVAGRSMVVHGGIGPVFRSLDQLRNLSKPITILSPPQPLLRDVLWADPAENDRQSNFSENIDRGPQIVKFGPDVVFKFLQENNLDFIFRAHQPVLDGFEYFASG